MTAHLRFRNTFKLVGVKIKDVRMRFRLAAMKVMIGLSDRLDGRIQRTMGQFEDASQEQRNLAIAAVYTCFEDYDRHFEVTNHYGAIRTLLDSFVTAVTTGAVRLPTPIFDPSAGTGEMTGYLVRRLRENGVALSERDVLANDLSEGQVERMRRKNLGVTILGGRDMTHLDLETGSVGTVFISQTFHIIDLETRVALLHEIDRILAADGTLIVVEEHPFVISPTSFIAAVMSLIKYNASKNPIRGPEELIRLIKTSANVSQPTTYTAQIDPQHAMKLHMFTRKGRTASGEHRRVRGTTPADGVAPQSDTLDPASKACI